MPRAAAAILISALATEAHALWDDQFELFAAETYTYDGNVFRLSDEVDPVEAIGSRSRGDRYRTTEAGVRFDIPAGRQRFVGHVVFSRYRFERFGALDQDGHEGQAEWRWRVGDSLGGAIGYADRLGLASLANVQNDVQSTVPNFIDTREGFVNATYGLSSQWQMQAGLSRLEQSNTAAEFRLSDMQADTAELTVGHVTRASSKLGLSARLTEGELPNLQIVDGTAVDNSFRQRQLTAFLQWPLTDASQLDFEVGRVSRRHVEQPNRDFTDLTYRAAYEWKPTGTLTLGTAVQRGISENEQVNVGFVWVERVGLQARYRQSEKVEWSMDAGYADRTYLGRPAPAQGALQPRTERLLDGTLRLYYRATSILTFELAARRQERSSNAELGDYDAFMLSVGLRVAF